MSKKVERGRTDKIPDAGFGFDPAESGHHFVLRIPASDVPDFVLLEERFSFGDDSGGRPPEPRSRLDLYTWGRVAEPVQTHFNRRLKDAERQASRFRAGENCLAPYLGKELALLLWSLDAIDPTDIPNALANWQGLVPEERWWLYTMVKASGAGPDARERGWRKAIRIAFAESPAPPPAEGGAAPREEVPSLTFRRHETDDQPDLAQQGDPPAPPPPQLNLFP